MAVAITAGSGTNIATDNVSGDHYQGIKVYDATAGSTVGAVVSTLGIYTEQHLKQLEIATTSGGLTTASTAYTAGDQVGTEFSFANAVRTSGGTCTVVGVRLFDKADIAGAYEVFLAGDTITPASDNAAYSISDTDGAKVAWNIQLGLAFDLGGCRTLGAYGISAPITCTGTTLYATLRTAIGHTFFSATTDLILTLSIVQD